MKAVIYEGIKEGMTADRRNTLEYLMPMSGRQLYRRN